MKTPMTQDRLRQHITYSWWKYVVLAVAAVMGWNIIFSVTAYRAPEDKKVTVYYSGMGDQEAFEAYLANIRATEMEDMEDIHSVYMLSDETYGAMQMLTYMAAAEGDLYILKKDDYQAYAAQGFFVPLDTLPDEMGFDQSGTSFERGWRRVTDTQERHLFGIPLSVLPGLNQYMYLEAGDYYISIAVNNGNDENTLKLLKIILRDMAAVGPMPK